MKFKLLESKKVTRNDIENKFIPGLLKTYSTDEDDIELLVDSIWFFIHEKNITKLVYVKFIFKIFGEYIESEYGSLLDRLKVNDIRMVFNMFKSELVGIFDYIIGRNEGLGVDPYPAGSLPLSTISLIQIQQASESWHKSLKSESKLEEDDGSLLMKLENGYYWQNLETSYSEQEAGLMGHCARGSGTLYSLRKRDDNGVLRAFITIDVGDAPPTHSGVPYHQCKGRNNSHPKEEYYEYILQIFDRLSIKYYDSSYRPDLDFKLIDLIDYDMDLYEEYYAKSPGLIEFSQIIGEYNRGKSELLPLLIEELKTYKLSSNSMIVDDHIELVTDGYNDIELKSLVLGRYHDIMDTLFESGYFDAYYENSASTSELIDLLDDGLKAELKEAAAGVPLDEYLDDNEEVLDILKESETRMYETTDFDGTYEEMTNTFKEIFPNDPEWVTGKYIKDEFDNPNKWIPVKKWNYRDNNKSSWDIINKEYENDDKLKEKLIFSISFEDYFKVLGEFDLISQDYDFSPNLMENIEASLKEDLWENGLLRPNFSDYGYQSEDSEIFSDYIRSNNDRYYTNGFKKEDET